MSTNSTSDISKNTIKQVISALGEHNIVVDAPLKNHTWVKTGGLADIFFIAKSREDLILATQIAHRDGVPLFILGGGSNVLIRDKGIRGLVVKNRSANVVVDGNRVIAQSGITVNQLVGITIDHSLEGLEEFLGIPGTVGGAVFNNSHHLTHLIGDTIESVDVVGKDGEIKTYSQNEMKFSYDFSLIQETGDTILSATFLLKAGNKQLLLEKSRNALARRRATQPLEKPSPWCMFKNIKPEDAVHFNTPNHTVSAGQLIELSGMKGEKLGGAQVSTVHANFIVNADNALSEDIEKLSQMVIEKVKKTFGVTLQREVFIVGEM